MRYLRCIRSTTSGLMMREGICAHEANVEALKIEYIEPQNLNPEPYIREH